MGSGDGSSQGGNGNSGTQHIYDTDSSVQYTGQWVLNQFTDQNGHQQTYHSTAQNGSTIFAPFYGNQIKVMGITPTGQGPLTANYSIDGGQPSMASIPTITQSSPLFFQQAFLSPNTTLGNHNITITVLETGSGRNFSFQWFTVNSGMKDINDSSDNHHHNGHGDGHGTHTAAIVGGVLGAVIFLLFCLLGAFYFWRRRRLAQMSSNGQNRLPPMIYYARPISDGSLREKADYMPEDSVIDTGSKFTFARHGGTSTNPARSWLSVDMPPTVPRSAVVNDRISDWSSYKGSSVIVEQPKIERSRFSPYTTTTFTPMAFREPTPLPGTRRSAGIPSKIETLTMSSSESLGPYESRRF